MKKMSVKVIPTQVHGVLDYLAGGALLAALGLLGPNEVVWTKNEAKPTAPSKPFQGPLKPQNCC
jgi:hypothetical protein